MNVNPQELEESRLTAYALGEIEDAAERELLDARFETDEAFRQAVLEIRELAQVLSAELKKEPCPALDEAARQSIREHCGTATSPRTASVQPARKSRAALYTIVACMAGCAALLIAGPYLYQQWAQPENVPVALTRAVEDSRQPAPNLIEPTETPSPDTAAPLDSVGYGEAGSGAPGRATAYDPAAHATQPSATSQPAGSSQSARKSETAEGDRSSLPTSARDETKKYYDQLSNERATGSPAGKPGSGASQSSTVNRPQMQGQEGQPASKPAAEFSIPAPASLPPANPVATTPAPAIQAPKSSLASNAPGERGDQLGDRSDGGQDGGGQAGSGSELKRQVDRLKQLSSKLDLAPEDARPASREEESVPLAETEHNTEAYTRIVDNAFLPVSENPLSTFSIDVDTASYSNVRRFLTQGQRPPKDAVRIEELLNYFSYSYAPPPAEGEDPFAAHIEVATCPWNGEHRLVRVGLKGREIERDQRPVSNLVFLVDVSGSMQPENKLPLLKQAMQMLVGQLSENDRVAIAVYAGASGLVLPSTTADNKDTILSALENLQAGGSTNGGAGIELAYSVARSNFIKGGTNRVILCTDGDFNVGVTNQGDLVRLIEDSAKSGVFLSVLGFGMGNLKDATLEQLADKGNGNYAYIDTQSEARKVLVEQLSGTLVTIAKDVKIQIEFNPAEVAAFRLIGYENRILAHQDFNDDTKDAGEIGAGHTVTALYEIVPAGKDVPVDRPAIDSLKYQKEKQRLTEAAGTGELLTLKMRYKQPDGDASKLLEFPVKDAGVSLGGATKDFRFAAAVASLGMILRDSPYKGTATIDGTVELAEEAKGDDPHGYRTEFVELLRQAKGLGVQ